MPKRRLLLVYLVVGSVVVRADLDCVSGFQSCPNQHRGLCCAQTSSCIPLAGGTTVLCCPSDRSCDRIRPITCDIREQDPDANPKAPIKTIVSDADLPRCGKEWCCPFGYECEGGRECVKNQDQSKEPVRRKTSSSVRTSSTSSWSRTTTATGRPSPHSSSSSTAASPSSESSSGPASVTAPSSSPSPAPPDAAPPSNNRGAVIGGTIGGTLAALAILAAVILLIRRRRRSSSNSSHHQRPPFGQVISAPLLNQDSYRSDFLRAKQAGRLPPTPPPAQRPASRLTRWGIPTPAIPNPFTSPVVGSPSSPNDAARSSITSLEELTARTGHVGGSRLAPIRTMRPSDFRRSRHVRHQRASENIDVFADPDIAPSADFRHDANRDTSLTVMMEQAGLGDLRRGRPYVPGTTPRI
ncbi:hypothetical protein XA68_14372 [Ophiocordyceps unilateralis]|uniref:Mid2 domain-containing protein n=1 Tax=Ophiocordyceps unilateralis TaxID=268505 RepID=A0A2A9PAI6_OPHUN|nr:hypothetical protein XA68_14372 [Ophiocordyceps unilateralis]